MQVVYRENRSRRQNRKDFSRAHHSRLPGVQSAPETDKWGRDRTVEPPCCASRESVVNKKENLRKIFEYRLSHSGVSRVSYSAVIKTSGVSRFAANSRFSERKKKSGTREVQYVREPIERERERELIECHTKVYPRHEIISRCSKI